MINLGVLAEDHLIQIHQAELQCTTCYKGSTKIVQNRGIVIVSKHQEKIADQVY